MRLNEIHIRDPFILPVDGVYYLYGSRGWETWLDHASGLDVYTSRDLENWSGPTQVFTPPGGLLGRQKFLGAGGACLPGGLLHAGQL